MGKKGHKTHNNIYKNFKRQLHTFLGVVVHHPFENSTNILPGFSVDKGYLLLFFFIFHVNTYIIEFDGYYICHLVHHKLKRFRTFLKNTKVREKE